ncbi:MAG: zf-HC2 domain-containing protein [Butyrivibrio sp.]|nr:zf-HC2 domain-containing protein [Butyrivibrio sp.]
MTCKEAEKLIPLFLDDDLDNHDLSDFLYHVEACPDCREELTIQFLVKVGMKRLEDGNTFNLRNELDALLHDAKKRLNAREYLVLSSYFLQAVVIALGGITLFLALFLS